MFHLTGNFISAKMKLHGGKVGDEKCAVHHTEGRFFWQVAELMANGMTRLDWYGYDVKMTQKCCPRAARMSWRPRELQNGHQGLRQCWPCTDTEPGGSGVCCLKSQRKSLSTNSFCWQQSHGISRGEISPKKLPHSLQWKHLCSDSNGTAEDASLKQGCH